MKATVLPWVFGLYQLSLRLTGRGVYLADSAEVRYQVVSGFVFLRFFAPAILGPRLFQLRSDVPVSAMVSCVTGFDRCAVVDNGSSPHLLRAFRTRW